MLRTIWAFKFFVMIIVLWTSIAQAQFPMLNHDHFIGPGGELNLARAEAGTAIALLILYPDHEFYFLARDAERFAPITKLVAKLLNLPEPKIHVISVSTVSKNDPNLPKYLHQNDLSDESMGPDRKVLIFDTGFEGTIIDRILESISTSYHSQIRGQMLECTSHRYPSLKTFGEDAGPLRWFMMGGLATDQFYAVGLHGSTLPKKTGKALSYRFNGSTWDVVTDRANGASSDSRIPQPEQKNDASIDPIAAESLLQKTLARIGEADMQAWLFERAALWNSIVGHLRDTLVSGRAPLRGPYQRDTIEDRIYQSARAVVGRTMPVINRTPPPFTSSALPRLSFGAAPIETNELGACFKLFK